MGCKFCNRHITQDVDASMNVIVTAPEPKLLKSVALDDFYVYLWDSFFYLLSRVFLMKIPRQLEFLHHLLQSSWLLLAMTVLHMSLMQSLGLTNFLLELLVCLTLLNNSQNILNQIKKLGQ